MIFMVVKIVLFICFSLHTSDCDWLPQERICVHRGSDSNARLDASNLQG